MTMKKSDVTWLAGLLEGDGCFSWARSSDRHYGHPRVQLNMADEDVVKKAGQFMGTLAYSKSTYGIVKATHNKPMYRLQICCAKAVKIMKTVLPYMGKRRTAKIEELLDRYAKRPGYKRGQKIA